MSQQIIGYSLGLCPLPLGIVPLPCFQGNAIFQHCGKYGYSCAVQKDHFNS